MSRPVRLPAELYEEVAALAAAENRSLANMVRQLLLDALDLRRAIDHLESARETGARVVEEQATDLQELAKSDFKKGKR